MKKLLPLLRAALIGALAMIVMGSLIVAGEQSKAHSNAGVNGGEAHAAEPAASDASKPSPRAAMMMFGLLGAIVAVLTHLLLLLFAVGPVTKVVFGLVCGPVIPVFFFAPPEIEQGHAENVGGLLMIGMLIGLLVGLLDANRVAAERRALNAPEG
jgi:uncharacterized integral membrane protein